MYRQMDIQVPTFTETSPFHGARPTGRDLRKVLAKLNTEHQLGLPGWFFGYGPDGKPDNSAQPRITMGNNSQGSLRIVAIGSEASDLLLEKCGPIQAAMIRACDTLVHANMRSGPHILDASAGNGFAKTDYWMHRVVVGKTHYESFWWRSAHRVEAGGAWAEKDFALLSDIIADGIFEQARLQLQAGDELHGELGEWLENKLATEDAKTAQSLFKKRLGVTVLGIKGHTAHRATGPQGVRVMLKDVEFTMAARLEGPWIVGRNRIEGFGTVQIARRPVFASAQAASTVERAL